MSKNNNKFDLLNSIYFGKDGGSFSGIEGLFKAARRIDPSIRKTDVSSYLSQQTGYQQTKQGSSSHILPKYKSKRFHQVAGPGYISADTFFLNRLKGPYNYALILQDMFTRLIVVKFMRTLSSKTATNALRNAMSNELRKWPVLQVYTDNG